MRVLVVHHGPLPAEGQPATGGAIRAWHLGRGLQAAGHEVHWLAREQDVPGGFASPADLVRKAMARRPDAVISVQLEDAPALRAVGVPLVVDLYAPRLLEAPFAGELAATAPAVLRALRAGDVFLCSSRRQRDSWLGVLALAGVDVRRDPTLLAPIASRAPARRRRSDEIVLVGGGGAWPWIDAAPGVAAVLAALDRHDTGRIEWFGPADHLPEHPRLQRMGRLPWDELVAHQARCTAALDWLGDNPERDLALGFRHADALAAGLPVLCAPGTAVAEALGPAAWTGAVDDVIDALVEDHRAGGEARQRRSDAARDLAKARSARATAAALDAWLAAPGESHRAPRGPLLDLADLAERAAAAEARAETAADRAARAEAEAVAKRQELAEAQARIHTLLSSVDRLSRAVDEVASFKKEAVTVLGHRSFAAEEARDVARDRVAALEADLAKKQAETEALHQRLKTAATRAEAWQAELDRLRAETDAQDEELADLRADVRKKNGELREADAERARLEGELARAREARPSGLRGLLSRDQQR